MASGSYNSGQGNGATLAIPASAYNIRISIAGARGGNGGSDSGGNGGSGRNGRSGTFSLPDFSAITVRSYSGGSGTNGGGCFNRARAGGSSSVARGGDGGSANGCSGSGGGGGGASGVYSVTHGQWIIVAGGGGGGGGGAWNRGANDNATAAGGFGSLGGISNGSGGSGSACGDGSGGGGGGGGAGGGGGGGGGCDNSSSSTGGGGGGSGYVSARTTLLSQGENGGGGYVSISYSYAIAEINYFRAIPNPRTDGTYNVELQWQAIDAASASIDQGVGSVSLTGTQTVNTGLSPSNQILTKTYTLTVTGLDGSTISQSITVAMVDGSVTTNNTSFYSSGPISFSSLRTNFKETVSGSISASQLIRKTSTSLTNPIVPDSTENRISGPLGNGITSSEQDLSISQFRNSIKYYKLVQSGGVIDLDIDTPSNTISTFSGWNNNLDKNIVKTFTISGNCQSSDTYYYQSPQTPAAKFSSTTAHNLTIAVTGSMKGSDGMNNLATSSGATSRTGSKLITPNPNGGNCMEIDVTNGSITVDVGSSASIVKGNKFSAPYSDGAAITGTNYTVQGSISGTTVQGSYLAS